MHKSYLEFDFRVEDLLFKGLTVDSGIGMVGLCLAVAVFTFMYETMKTLRQRLVSSLGKVNHDIRYVGESHSERSMLVEMKESHQRWNRNSFNETGANRLNLTQTGSVNTRIRVHTIHAFLYMIQVTMGYFLMLIIMSYNAWLAITVFTAAGFSYYFYSTFVLNRPTVVPIEILSPEAYDQ